MALEYLEGQTLRERLEQERLSVRETIRIAKQIADALNVAHRKNLVHLDDQGEIPFCPWRQALWLLGETRLFRQAH